MNASGYATTALFILLITAAQHTSVFAQDANGTLHYGNRPYGFHTVQTPTDEAVSFLEELEVQYPEELYRRKVEGVAIVAAWVDGGGAVSYAEIMESSGTAVLDSAALDAVVRGMYRAARRSGRAVGSRVTIPVEFRVGDSGHRGVGGKSTEQLQRERKELENARRMLEEEEQALREEIERLKAQQNQQTK